MDNINIDLFIFDLDGTIYLGNKLIDGALDFINELKNSSTKFCFFTNNDSKSSDFFINKLKNMGIKINKTNFYTAGLATIDYINMHYKNKPVYLLGTKSLKNEFSTNGIKLDDENPEIVVISYDTELTYEKLDKACYYIRNGAKYIATHPDYNCPTQSGFSPDTGSFIKLIEASTGRLPDIILGKPNKNLGKVICDKYKVFPERVAMVGDRLMTDMKFAINCGFKSVLVLSGETTLEMFRNSKLKLDMVVDSVKSLI